MQSFPLIARALGFRSADYREFVSGISLPGTFVFQDIPDADAIILVAARVNLTTSAVAGARSPDLRVTEQSGVVWQWRTAGSQAAATSAQYAWGWGSDNQDPSINSSATIPIHPLIIMSPTRISINTTNLDAADVFSNGTWYYLVLHS